MNTTNLFSALLLGFLFVGPGKLPGQDAQIRQVAEVAGTGGQVPGVGGSKAPVRPAVTIPIVVSAWQPSAVRIAAEDLGRALTLLHRDAVFPLMATPPAIGRYICVGSLGNDPHLADLVETPPAGPESYVVTGKRDGTREIGCVVGADARGVAYGVYALLKKLGAGFYLSGDTWPAAPAETFAFDAWRLASRPLARERMVFNWHNFLSGCTTWNYPDWEKWIDQSVKLGCNTIMVHAYGNNPMVEFAFEGQAKPVGFIATTVRGRDWSTHHVNDMRRVPGGAVFAGPVFGADAAQAPEDSHVPAVRELMQRVFAHAAARATAINLAVDVDTASANPQQLIKRLPPGARFAIGGDRAAARQNPDTGTWLADPDSPEGYRYYKAQIDALLAAYPQLDCVTAWFREKGQRTWWMDVKVEEMPAAWQAEYATEIGRTHGAAQLYAGENIFALAKILKAFRRALDEGGHGNVQLALGSWRFKFLDAADRFLPEGVKIVALDYDVLDGHSQLVDETSREVIRRVARHRPVIPVVWAHHDDGGYIGRPITPYDNFLSRLDDAHAAGFGIMHWMTRPLDLYFASLCGQVWQGGENEPLAATCDRMAQDWFGPAAREPMAAYLGRWVREAPIFGRETGSDFIDRPLADPVVVAKASRERVALIDQVDRDALNAEQRDRLDYFRGLERFIAALHATQAGFRAALALHESGDYPAARKALASCQPERVMELFAAFSALGGETRGEQGVLVSLTTRWLIPYVRLRQALGVSPVRYNFGPTRHEALAQSVGANTYHFGPGGDIWQTWGETETGARAFAQPPVTGTDSREEIARSGIESVKPVTLILRPIATSHPRDRSVLLLASGDYRLRLYYASQASEVAVQGDETSPLEPQRIEVASTAAPSPSWREQTFAVKVGASGLVRLTVTPVVGRAVLHGAVLEPVAVADRQ